MCVICIQYQLGKLTSSEVNKALTEVLLTSEDIDLEHAAEILEMIEKEEKK